MHIKAGLVPTESPALRSSTKDRNFSKDAEIIQRVIEFATDGLTANETIATLCDTNWANANLNLRDVTKTVNVVLQNCSNTDFDGCFVGFKNQTFSPSTAFRDVPAVVPGDGARNNETVVYINGICTTVERQAKSLKTIADLTGSRAIGIHNATQGGLLDIEQSSSNTLDLKNNRAIDTLADTVYNELCAGRGMHLLAHSQGGIIVSRALQNVFNRFRLENVLSRQEAENLLAHVKVETFGGVSRHYPDGPQYIHYINRKDLVPQLFGLREFLNPFAHEGRDAVIHYFNASGGFLAHGLEDVYLHERVQFEQSPLNKFSH